MIKVKVNDMSSLYLNEYWTRELLLRGSPQFDCFYKSDLINFCRVAQELIQEKEREINDLKKEIRRLKNIKV